MAIRRCLTLIVAPFLGLALFALVDAAPAAAAAPSSFVCTNMTLVPPQAIPPGTYSSLTFPAGTSCAVEGTVTVQGGVTIEADAILGVLWSDGTAPGFSTVWAPDLTVNGPINVGTDGVFAFDAFTASEPGNIAPPVTVNGPVTLGDNAWFGQYMSVFHGPIQANDPAGMDIQNSEVSGRVTSVGGGKDNPVMDALAGFGDAPSPYQYVVLYEDTISGPVSVTSFAGSGGVFIVGAEGQDAITGPLTLSDYTGEGGAAILYATINGPLTVTNNNLGPNGSDISDDVINGPLTFSNNSGGQQGTSAEPYAAYLIGGDTVSGPATCTGNNPAPNSYWPAKGSFPGWSPPSGPSVVHGPVRGNQASTCTWNPAWSTLGPPWSAAP